MSEHEDTPARKADTDRTEAADRGRGIMLSYKELVALNQEMSSIRAMLQAALALQGAVEDLAKRVGFLEREYARRDGANGTWRLLLAFAGGAVSAIIGGGALQYLPSIMGVAPH